MDDGSGAQQMVLTLIIRIINLLCYAFYHLYSQPIIIIIIGPSGVRALPLAAGINEGGHYFAYIIPLFFSLFFSYHRYSKPQKGLS